VHGTSMWEGEPRSCATPSLGAGKSAGSAVLGGEDGVSSSHHRCRFLSLGNERQSLGSRVPSAPTRTSSLPASFQLEVEVSSYYCKFISIVHLV